MGCKSRVTKTANYYYWCYYSLFLAVSVTVFVYHNCCNVTVLLADVVVDVATAAVAELDASAVASVVCG